MFVVNHVKIVRITMLERCNKNFLLSETYCVVTNVSDGLMPFPFFAVFVVSFGGAVTMGTSMGGVGKLRFALVKISNALVEFQRLSSKLTGI